MGRGGLGCAALVDRAARQGFTEKQDLNNDLKEEKGEQSRHHGEYDRGGNSRTAR